MQTSAESRSHSGHPREAVLFRQGESPGALRERLRAALLGAAESAEGRALLEALGLARFEPALADDYAGYAALLRGTWRPPEPPAAADVAGAE